MNQELTQALSYVLWIGGATDSSKTTLAQMIAARHKFQCYHYDPHDLPHVKHLAQTHPRYRTFLEMSLRDKSGRVPPSRNPKINENDV